MKSAADELTRLVRKHPALFRGRRPRVASHVPAGWVGLVDALLSDLETTLGPATASFRVRQIKEKFGALRLYFELGRRGPVVVDTITPTGHETFVGGTAEGDLLGAIQSLIDVASEQSTKTCMVCGMPARLASHDGWLAARCASHATGRGGSRDELDR
jgi:hypothetical protein